jgi:hypothetical protein
VLNLIVNQYEAKRKVIKILYTRVYTHKTHYVYLILIMVRFAYARSRSHEAGVRDIRGVSP